MINILLTLKNFTHTSNDIDSKKRQILIINKKMLHQIKTN